jgi:hypothetical protein
MLYSKQEVNMKQMISIWKPKKKGGMKMKWKKKKVKPLSLEPQE